MNNLTDQNSRNIFQTVNQWLAIAGVEKKGNIDQFRLCKALILEELEELEEAFLAGDKKLQKDGVVDLIWVTLNWDYMNDLNSEEYAERVAKSNWSKFCKTVEEAEKTVDAYIRGVHPSKPGAKIECYIQQSGEYWIVKRLSDNKILKSINFVEP